MKAALRASQTAPVPRAHAARIALALAACALLACLACLATPAPALAKSYSCPSVNLTAQAQTDGSLHVVEQRAFDFDGAFTAVWWEFQGLPQNAEVTVNAVRMAHVDAAGSVEGEWMALDSVPFKVGWREEGGPGTDSWSFDRARNTLYAFFDREDTQMIFEIDYVVANGVQAYDDIAEVYWKYVGEGREVDSENVSTTIVLPVPPGVTVEPGGNVRAWGHGPLDGVVSVNEDGTVTYDVSRVVAGQYAEARVVFPVSWLTNLDAEARLANQGTTRLDTVLAEEKAWTDQANNQRVNDLRIRIGLVVACALILAVGAILFLRFGREHTPDFTEKYWRDVPKHGMRPAVVGRLWRWNHESADDFTATLLDLARRGVLRIEAGAHPDSFGKEVEDYRVVCVDDQARKVTDPIERATLKLLFEDVAGGEPSLWLASLREHADRRPEAYVESMKGWQAVLSDEVAKQDFFEPAGYKLRKALAAAAVVVLVVGLLMTAVTDELLAAALAVPTCAVLALLANYMPRRSEHGNNVAARAKALRNWMRDASSCADFPPESEEKMSELMVYAFLFGVTKPAMKDWEAAVPDASRRASDFGGMSFMPWYAWYAASGVAARSASETINASVDETYEGARAAAVNLSAGSSAGGFGGGFSAGGGGGFGAGGGAR
ncbi:DUF2207 domain-containing protein [Adlercreutzia sp. ZJ242]|uniref:DUF2207 domain-containing protein n=1 Tax=Adlercreutzia sp. ZJ242 TaxID=2709409 RepID=UPI0013EA6481|nr:DUF2207 domain-containing protein [Adlercreutzia sp. ZJ242]